ncbi:MAG: AraC family transcriptional regulator [Defluviitaleaceae bacterium]|nr:AraC family transcriptional regulator [Defluviitaleaceae bacterium]
MENPVLRSLEIIESQISEKLTVEHIAGSVHFSKFHYQRLFRETVGESVMEYVTKRKLTLAGRELLETNAAVTDVAIKFGYDSREGFSRSFKAYMGVTPGEYRKYSLTAIEKKTVKERGKMTYSKSTDKIIRELNDFIVKARETANHARKEGEPFRSVIADRTDNLANRVQAALERITAIAERPDEITNRFAILQILTDSAFESNLLAFNVGLTVSRAQPTQDSDLMREKFYALAVAAHLKADKVTEFFNELSALIFEDIKKSYDDKIRQVVQVAKSATASVSGYDNIKNELTHFATRLEQIPFDEKTALRLDDCVFQLNIISFAADMDITHNPQDKEMFAKLAEFKDALTDAVEFVDALPKGVATVKEYTPQQHMQNCAFQGNILLFYTRGEVEKMNNAGALDDDNNRAAAAVCDKINCAIQLANNAADATAVSQNYFHAADEMNRLADVLGLCGNPIKFLATEMKRLAERV